MDLNKKNYEIIAEELQRIIESGIFQEGEKLDTIENMAKQYHVGRSTIREALSHLKARGLIETKQGGGTYVKKSLEKNLELSEAHREDFKELLEVRKILELGSIELAAMNRTEENIQELTRIVKQMEEAVGNEEISQVYDVNFHLAIARSSQNKLLQKMMEGLSSTLTRTIRDSRKLWMYSEKETAARLFEEHQRMLETIIKQDVRLAKDTMDKHLKKIESVMKSSRK